VRVLLGAGGLLFVCWNGGTALGVLLGDVIGDPNRIGLDAAFPALFLALLAPQLTGLREVVAALLGGGIALLLVPFTLAGVPIIAGAAACLVGARKARGGQGSSRRECP
jgi:predicted branched-subunit amino acid permease